MLEGALFEGRLGNRQAARTAFAHLCVAYPSCGPIYLEASKYEEREDKIDEALTICEDGLDQNVKYSPLWFQYLKLYEKCPDSVKASRFDSLEKITDEMLTHISRELDWKVYIEIA